MFYIYVSFDYRSSTYTIGNKIFDTPYPWNSQGGSQRSLYEDRAFTSGNSYQVMYNF